MSEPDRIRRIHQEYIGAGARVIETNTFGANAVRLERFGLESRVSEILNRKRKLTAKMMKALHDNLGLSAELLLSAA